MFNLESNLEQDFIKTIWGQLLLKNIEEILQDGIIKLENERKNLSKYAELLKYEQIINQINEYFIKENKKVSDCFDKLYKIIKEKKNELIKQLGVIQKEKLQSFDDVRRININIADKFIELNNSMLYIKNDLLPKGQYEHFYQLHTYF